MSDSASRYILYRTTATTDEAVGLVVNAFLWTGEGEQLPIPTGTGIAADPSGKFAIGSIYTEAGAAS